MDEKECREGMRFILISGHITVAAMVLATYFLYPQLPALANMETLPARWALTLKCMALAVLPFLLGIQAIANHRAFSAANNPLLGVETPRQRIHIRYTQNTLEQFILFFITLMTAAIYLDTGELMRLIPLLTAFFIFFRLLFWIGYLNHWKYRAPGMVGTGFSYIPLLFYTAYRVLSDLF